MRPSRERRRERKTRSFGGWQTSRTRGHLSRGRHKSRLVVTSKISIQRTAEYVIQILFHFSRNSWRLRACVRLERERRGRSNLSGFQDVRCTPPYLVSRSFTGLQSLTVSRNDRSHAGGAVGGRQKQGRELDARRSWEEKSRARGLGCPRGGKRRGQGEYLRGGGCSEHWGLPGCRDGTRRQTTRVPAAVASK